MAGDTKVKFSLPNEQVEIRYVKTQKGLIVDPRHIAFGGLLEGAYVTFTTKQLRNGTYANVLTKEEKEYLEDVLALPKDGLSVYNKKDNYWGRLKIKLGKEGGLLDLSDPEQYIKYKVLLSYEDVIAPNISEVHKKPTYRFVIVRKDDEAKVVLKKLDHTKEAYKLLGKIEDNREAMIDFLRVKNIKVADDTSTDWLNAEVGKQLVENPAKFVETLKDPSYNTRVLLYKSLAKGEIVKKGQLYYSKDGEALSEPNQPATLDNVISYLESNMNQEYRLLLMGKVN